MMSRILVTGSSGFLASNLIPWMVIAGHSVVGVDNELGPRTSRIVDLRDRAKCFALIEEYKPEWVIHLAARIDFNGRMDGSVYENNTVSTKNICDAAREGGVSRFAFTSSCSIFAGSQGSIFDEEAKSQPVDEYGNAKVWEENYIQSHRGLMTASIVRTPMIVGSGRVGMLSILFELINRGNALWILGDGGVRHQLVYVVDICEAILKLIEGGFGGIYNVGSDSVPTFKETFEGLIRSVGAGSRILRIPKSPALFCLNLTRALKLSPIGHYQLRMLTQDFAFDFRKLTADTGWKPTKSNVDMLLEAFNDFKASGPQEFELKSVNQSHAPFGVLSFLKYIY